MELTRRQTELLLYLIQSGTPRYGSELAKQFSVTDRTIRNDIQKINDNLSSYRIYIKGEKQSGYFIPGECMMRIREESIVGKIAEQMDFDIPETQNERIVYLTFNMLFGNRYSQEDMEELFYLSPSVVYGDIKALEKWLTGRRINMKLRKAEGKYYLKEEESVIRSLISGIYTQRNNMVMELKYSYFISGGSEFYEMVNHLVPCVVEFMKEENLQLTGRSIQSFAADIALAYYRTSQHYYLTDLPASFPTLKMKLKECLLRYDGRMTILNEEDYGYLLARLKGKDFLGNNPLLQIREETRAAVRGFSKAISRYGITLVHEDYLLNEVESILYIKEHRFYYSISRRQRIFENNPEELYLAALFRYSCHCYYPETELNVHDMARLTVCLKHSVAYEKKKLLLVCDHSRYTAKGLMNEINRLFSDRIVIEGVCSQYEYRAKKEGIDGILTTVSLDETEVPCLELEMSSFVERLGKTEFFLEQLNRREVVSKEMLLTGSNLFEVLCTLLKTVKETEWVTCVDWEYVLHDTEESAVLYRDNDVLNVFIPLLSSDRIRKYEFAYCGAHHGEPYSSVALYIFADNIGMVRSLIRGFPKL